MNTQNPMLVTPQWWGTSALSIEGSWSVGLCLCSSHGGGSSCSTGLVSIIVYTLAGESSIIFLIRMYCVASNEWPVGKCREGRQSMGGMRVEHSAVSE